MKPRPAPRKKAPERPIVACDACLNWHREGKHTADAATRRANLLAAKQREHERGQRRLTENAEYYVWVVDSNESPIPGEGPYGPYGRTSALQFGRIAASGGKHDRIVSRGLDPKAKTFQVIRHYQARTGDRLL